MRNILIAAALIAASLTAPCNAFEIEQEHVFSVDEPQAELKIISTTDLIHFLPLIKAFQRNRPDLSIGYTVASSAELYKAIGDEAAPFDLAISSAMDLQMKLANDGLALSHRSPQIQNLPAWARWRDKIFAFTQEPAVLIASRKGFEGLKLPENRQELISLLRDHPERFRGRIGTYDLRVSGAGYLIATQDARNSETFWRLAEVMGGLSPKLYCCSADMINDLKSGELLFAYNVVGSYAAAQFGPNDDGIVLPLYDFTNVLLRTALIPRTAPDPDLGGAFIDFLLSTRGRALMATETRLPPIDGEKLADEQYLRPIRLGPGLLVYLDQIKRQNFLRDWTAALVQP